MLTHASAARRWDTGIAVGVVVLTGFAAILMVGTMKAVALTAVLMVVGAVAVFRFAIALKILVGFIPLTGILRWADTDSVIAGGFASILSVLLIFALILRILNHRLRCSIPKRIRGSAGAVLVFISLLCVYVMAAPFSPLLYVLLVREYVVPFALVAFVYTVVRRDPAEANNMFFMLFAATAFVAAINLVHYYAGLGIDINRWVMIRGTPEPEIRTFLNVMAPRLQHILGLSSQGAGAVFYAIVAFIGVDLVRLQRRRPLMRGLLVLGVGMMVIAAFLSLSLSLISAILFITAFRFAWHRLERRSAVQAIRDGTVVLALVVVGLTLQVDTGSGDALSIGSYGASSFFGPVFPVFQQYTLGEQLFGKGLGLRGAQGIGSDLGINEAYVVDGWIFLGMLQLGIVGFVIMMSTWLMLIAQSLPLNKAAVVQNRILLICGMILVGGFGYSHSAAMLDRLFSPMLALAIGAILAVHSQVHPKALKIRPETSGQSRTARRAVVECP